MGGTPQSHRRVLVRPGLSEHGIHFWQCCRDTLVEENVIVDCARGIGFGLSQTGSCRTYPDDPYPTAGFKDHIDGIIRNNFVAAADADIFASPDGFDTGIAVTQAYGAKSFTTAWLRLHRRLHRSSGGFRTRLSRSTTTW